VHSKGKRSGEVEKGMNAGEKAEPAANLFRRSTDLLAPETDPQGVHHLDLPRLPHGATPRGLGEQGLVRTTGWLQFRAHPISSGLITALISLLLTPVVALALLPVQPIVSGLCVPLFPALGYGCWFLITTWLVPASAARNTGIVAARELKTGTWVRVHGMIGPIGQVARVQPEQEPASSTKDSVERVRVSFAGGITTSWPHDHLLHTVEPQN